MGVAASEHNGQISVPEQRIWSATIARFLEMLTTTLCKNSKSNTRRPAPPANGIGISSRLADSARMDEAELCSLLQTSVDGLPKEEAEVRRVRYGPNEVTFEKR